MRIISDVDISPCIKFLRSKLGLGTVGVEIGIWDGGNALAAIQHLEPKRYYMIDPYLEYADNSFKQSEYDSMYGETCKKFLDVKNSCLMRLPSLQASKLLEDNLDFVYIDGAHDYENKMLDLNIWYPKIKIGGVICGDDFNIPSVARAVKDFSKSRNLTFWISENSDPHPPEYWATRLI